MKRKNLTFRNFILIAALIAAMSIISACSGSDDDMDMDGDTTDGDVTDGDTTDGDTTDGDTTDGDVTDGDTEDPTNIRVIHLSPDAPAVDVFAAGTLRAIENVAFAEGTEYLSVPAGTYTFDVVPTGGDIGDSVLNVPDLMLESGKSYTAVAYGMVSNIAALALEDDLSSPGAETIRVRAIHAADGIGEVDIWNIPAEGDPAIIYEDVAYGDVGGYLELPAGSYMLGFDVDDDASPDLVFETGALPEGLVANLFAVKDGEEVFILAQLSDGTILRIDPKEEVEQKMTEVRFIHLAPPVAGVDIWLNGEIKAFEDLIFGKSTMYAEIPAGEYDVDVMPAGDTDMNNAILSLTVNLMADTSYTAAAYVGDGASALLLEDDRSETAMDSIRVRAMHTASGIGEVDIWNITDINIPSPLVVDLDGGMSSSALEIPSSAYVLGFDVDNNLTPDVTFSLPELQAGTIANVFAVNDEGDVAIFAQFDDSSVARLDAVDWAYVRVLHLSRTAGAVDIFIDGSEQAAITNLAFKNGTGYVPLPAGMHDFSIALTGEGISNTALAVNGIDLMSNSFYSIYAYNAEMNSTESLTANLIMDDISATDQGEIRLRAIHTAYGVGEVDIWDVTNASKTQTVYTDVGFGISGSALDISAGTYKLGFDANNDQNADFIFQLPELSSGTIINAFAVLDTEGKLSLIAQNRSGDIAEIVGAPAALD